MANLQVKDGANATKYLKASGTGTDLDPNIPEHKESNSAAILAALGGTLAVSGTVTTGGLTDAQLRATAVPVSGPVTDTQLRATPVPVSGTVTASGPLTDAQLRATAVPISGTVTANPTQRTLSIAAGTVASSGDNTLIAAPAAGNRIVIVEYQLQLEATTATVCLLKDSTTTITRWRGVNDGDGLIRQFPIDGRYKMTAATALVLNLSGANSVGYTVFYYVEAV